MTVFDDHDSFEEHWKGIFLESLLFGVCLMAVSRLDWDYGLWEGDDRGEEPFSSHHVKAHPADMIHH